MPPTSLNRRRALLLGAGSLLAAAVPARPALGVRRPRGFGLSVAPQDFGGGRVSRVLRARRRFQLVGLRDAPPGIEVRVRARGGEWSRWAPLRSHAGHRPDATVAPRASDPVWTGTAHELQLRARRAPDRPLRLHLVDPGPVPRRASLRSARAQSGPPSIIPRAGWGGDRVTPRAAPAYGQVQLAFVHHTVTANDYAPEQSAGIVLSIARYHRDVNGWSDIGYNFLVDRFGQVFEGRAGGIDQAVIGAHCAGSNSVSTGVAVLGTHDATAVEPASFDALARLLGWKLALHGVPATGQVAIGARMFERISGHRDGYATACPGDALYAQLPALRERAVRLAGPVAMRPQASLQATATAVPYGHGARLFGSVRHGDGSPAGGEAVSVQKRGSAGWVTVARAVTDGAGAWSAELPWRRSGRLRARALGVVTPAVAIAAVPRIGTRSLPRRVRAGRTVLLRGTIRPSLPVTVLVERDTGDGRWVTVARVRAAVRGPRWQARLSLRRPALYRITATTSARDGGGRGRAQVLRAVRAGRSLTGGAARPGTTAPPPATSGGLAAGS